MLRPTLPGNLSVASELRPNVWDLAALPLVLIFVFLLAYGGAQMTAPYNVGDPLPLTLDPANLPYYLLRTGLRMLLALMVSLVFTMIYATIAAKSVRAEKILIPILDILQSIPVLGFLSITVTGFIALFPGSLFGVECAAIFAIFTSQAWNMTFSVYQSLRTVPNDLTEAARMFHLSAWQRFWRLELPFAMPGLVWNMMISVSGGWFFVVASEAISVSNQNIMLPGIGSYIAMAIAARDMAAIGWAIAAMFVGIILYDQFIFRPLIAWSQKFKSGDVGDEDAPESWLLTLIQRTHLTRVMMGRFGSATEKVRTLFPKRRDGLGEAGRPMNLDWLDRVYNIALALAGAAALLKVGEFIKSEVLWSEVLQVFFYGCITALRILVMIAAASLVWVPIGVWIGLRPKAAANLGWMAQFLAAFPANLVFPLVVMGIVAFDLNVEIWLTPLMILGTQWYILFNVIGAAASLPTDLRDAAGSLGLTGWMKWRRFILPGIFPGYLTGCVTASAGSWNASIVAEVVNWGDTTLRATGLGSYIAESTRVGDFPRIALGISVMCLFVMGFNRFVWRPLYNFAAERLRLS